MTGEVTGRLAEAAQDCERAATELERAAAHLRTGAAHFRVQEVPRACAHLLAAQGHVWTVQRVLTERAVVHAERSQP